MSEFSLFYCYPILSFARCLQRESFVLTLKSWVVSQTKLSTASFGRLTIVVFVVIGFSLSWSRVWLLNLLKVEQFDRRTFCLYFCFAPTCDALNSNYSLRGIGYCFSLFSLKTNLQSVKYLGKISALKLKSALCFMLSESSYSASLWYCFVTVSFQLVCRSVGSFWTGWTWACNLEMQIAMQQRNLVFWQLSAM